jgi:uncharacterized UBP type Zn finger protein
MKIEIYYQNSKLTTEIKKDTLVKDLIYNLKQYLKTENSNFILFDSEQNKLKESDSISINKQNKLTFYLMKSSINKNNLINLDQKEKLTENLNINQLIMKCTGAKKLIEKPQGNNRVGLLELIDNRNNRQGRDNNAFESLINILQLLDDNNQIIFREEPIVNNNNPVEADEQALRELQDMGFPEDRARQALINSRNDINRATELLLGEGGD